MVKVKESLVERTCPINPAMCKATRIKTPTRPTSFRFACFCDVFDTLLSRPRTSYETLHVAFLPLHVPRLAQGSSVATCWHADNRYKERRWSANALRAFLDDTFRATQRGISRISLKIDFLRDEQRLGKLVMVYLDDYVIIDDNAILQDSLWNICELSYFNEDTFSLLIFWIQFRRY